jgi:pimeloyl-ACP methyl ester carboxylesterase
VWEAILISGGAGRLQKRIRTHQGVLRDEPHRGLKKSDVPTLIVHGDDDQIVPLVARPLAFSKLVKDATLNVYEGAPHGLAGIHEDRLNADLLAFLSQFFTTFTWNW